MTICVTTRTMIRISHCTVSFLLFFSNSLFINFVLSTSYGPQQHRQQQKALLLYGPINNANYKPLNGTTTTTTTSSTTSTIIPKVKHDHRDDIIEQKTMYSNGIVLDGLVTMNHGKKIKEIFSTPTNNDDDDGGGGDFPTESTTTTTTTTTCSNTKNTRQVLDAIIGRTAIPIIASVVITTSMNLVDPIVARYLGSSSSTSTTTIDDSTTTTPIDYSLANHCFSFILSFINYVPTITAPMVATAVGAGNYILAQERVGASLFMCYILGLFATVLLLFQPNLVIHTITSTTTDNDNVDVIKAIQYLRIRAISIVPILISSSAFAGFRGSLDTITPLKVTLVTQIIKFTVQPILAMFTPFGTIGLVLATTVSDIVSGFVYMVLMAQRRLLQLQLSLKLPPFSSIITLVTGGLCLFSRQTILNASFLLATQRIQSLLVVVVPPGRTDVTTATRTAFAIVNRIHFTISGIVHVAMQATAATLVPFILTKFGTDDARTMAERINVWGTVIGIVLGIVQYIAMPYILPLVTTDPIIQERSMTITTYLSLFHIFNGSIAVGEGVMVGLGNYRDLILISLTGLGIMILILQSPIGQDLTGVAISIFGFYFFQTIAITLHRRLFSPIRVVSNEQEKTKN